MLSGLCCIFHIQNLLESASCWERECIYCTTLSGSLLHASREILDRSAVCEYPSCLRNTSETQAGCLGCSEVQQAGCRHQGHAAQQQHLLRPARGQPGLGSLAQGMPPTTHASFVESTVLHGTALYLMASSHPLCYIGSAVCSLLLAKQQDSSASEYRALERNSLGAATKHPDVEESQPSSQCISSQGSQEQIMVMLMSDGFAGL